MVKGTFQATSVLTRRKKSSLGFTVRKELGAKVCTGGAHCARAPALWWSPAASAWAAAVDTDAQVFWRPCPGPQEDRVGRWWH